MNICIISESKSADNPESFVKAHKDLLAGNIHFLYGSTFPLFSERYGSLIQYPSLYDRFKTWLGVRNSVNPLVRGLKNYLKQEKIQVVLAEYGTTGAQIFPICRDLRIPLIVHFHGYDISKKEVLDYHKASYTNLFSYATFIIAVSNDMKDDLVAVGAPAHKIAVNPYGPQERFFTLKPNFSGQTILAVGRMVDKKAPYYTILAFQKLLRHFPSIKMNMIGTGYLENAMRNLVRGLGLERNVAIIGGVKHSDIFKYYSDAYCFIQHSVVAEDGDSEGTPVGILEAAAAGLPVISTKHKGIKDAVVDSITGFLVEEHNVDAMFLSLLKITSDRNLASKMGIAGRKHVRENFSLNSHIETLNVLIRQANQKC